MYLFFLLSMYVVSLTPFMIDLMSCLGPTHWGWSFPSCYLMSSPSWVSTSDISGSHFSFYPDTPNWTLHGCMLSACEYMPLPFICNLYCMYMMCMHMCMAHVVCCMLLIFPWDKTNIQNRSSGTKECWRPSKRYQSCLFHQSIGMYCTHNEWGSQWIWWGEEETDQMPKQSISVEQSPIDCQNSQSKVRCTWKNTNCNWNNSNMNKERIMQECHSPWTSCTDERVEDYIVEIVTQLTTMWVPITCQQSLELANSLIQDTSTAGKVVA